MGKTAVRSNDSPGFISFRILMPYVNEAAIILQEGVATAKDIDKALKLGTRSAMGPLEMADFIGLDTCLASMRFVDPCPFDLRCPRRRAVSSILHALMTDSTRAARLCVITGYCMRTLVKPSMRLARSW